MTCATGNPITSAIASESTRRGTVSTRFHAQLVPKLFRTRRSIRPKRPAQRGEPPRTVAVGVLHHWLAATVIPKPLTTAIPATHMPRPLRKLASLGTWRRTNPSPPANHAQPARMRRRDFLRVTAASIVSPPSVVEAVLTRRTEDARSADELAPRSDS